MNRSVSRTNKRAIIQSKKHPGPEDTLTPQEEAVVLKGERQLRRGEYVTLEQLERELDRQALKRRRKTA